MILRPAQERFLGLRTIFGADGEHVTPYLTQAWIGRLRLHVFHRGDADPDCHDHPWDFWTFPLTPYVEEVVEPEDRHFVPLPWSFEKPQPFRLRQQVVRGFRLHYRRAEHTHRVLGRWSGRYADSWLPVIGDGRVVTLVWRGRARRKWGFLKNRDGRWCWTPWKDYVFDGGKHAPCEPGGGDA